MHFDGTFPPQAIAHLDTDQVMWLTSVTDSGAPSPTPVWFLRDGISIVSFSEATARKVRNLRSRPAATLHFNSDPSGLDIVVIQATAEVDDDVRPSSVPGYLEKYATGLATWGLTADGFDASTTTRLRFTPTRIWLGPAG